MENAIRVGIVQQVNAGTRQVRVHFPDVEITSDWLKVLSASISLTIHNANGEDLPTHSHSAAAAVSMPAVDDVVLCVYSGGFNSDGYVLGVLK